MPVPAFDAGAIEKEQYFFHPDHLGSSNYITNFDGEVSQHMEYFAFGETFVEEHKNSNNSPYKFNGKELDDESGLYYYGARYYDPRISIWASVDPLADYNPHMNDEHYIDGQHNGGVYNHFNFNTYSYCYQNPIKLVDPNGKQAVAGMIAGFIGELLVAVGTKMYSNNVNPGEALFMLDRMDVLNIAVGTAFGAASGVAELANKVRNPMVRNVLKFLLETSMEVIENLLKDACAVYTGKEKAIDPTAAIYGALASVGMGQLLATSGIKHKAFEKAEEKAQRNAAAAKRKVDDLSSRRNPSMRKIKNAQEAANRAEKEAKAMQELDVVGKGINGAVEGGAGNVASDVAKKNTTTKSN